ncbi:MAG: cytochrome c oxidase subunit II [Ignavibacteriaceae bacterium]|nr:cytochrome c oxidase subunit II [Ignavibacteriaceae bacterium]
MFDGASNFVTSVDNTFLMVLGISVFFLVLITGLMIYFVFKYSRKKNPVATNIEGNVALEITWTVIPTILVLVMFWYGWIGYKEMATIPEDAMKIDVTAQMWKWTFKYSTGLETDTLYVPANKPIEVILHSRDVNHAFFVSAFRVKKDVLPGRTNKAWFEAAEGSYDLSCAEYCGLNHSKMYTRVVALPEAEFNKWLEVKTKSSSKDSTESGKDTTAVSKD